MRRMAVGGVTAAMLLVLLGACGGSEASSSPSAEATATEVPVESSAPEAEEPSVDVDETAAPETVAFAALCAGIGVRKGPTTGDDLLVRVNRGTKVRVVEAVTGDPYEAGSCGKSGDQWLKIDRIGGKSIKALYGVPYGYAAGGFFE